ncbi:hypothetical protein RJ639_017756 [Escallonia herrerae]|uniref:Uncharacterized protein n=1 Tax=Escallonia herrerae TaxID=1293975 RepID=A0AA88VD60_9ASTE|nr:hypothetical protein RJ639_017756 [Escallonia herrerae]
MVINGDSQRHSSVSDKLEALKNLIPAGNGDIKPDQLFQETADYIVHLQAKVSILQGANPLRTYLLPRFDGALDFTATHLFIDSCIAYGGEKTKRLDSESTYESKSKWVTMVQQAGSRTESSCDQVRALRSNPLGSLNSGGSENVISKRFSKPSNPIGEAAIWGK